MVIKPIIDILLERKLNDNKEQARLEINYVINREDII